MIFLSVVIPTANLLIFVFLIYRIWLLQRDKRELDEKAKNITEKEVRIDNDYHQVVDDTLNSEKKILDDAVKKAGSILTDSQYLSDSLKDTVDKAMQKTVQDVQEKTSLSSEDIVSKHKDSLSQISGKSLDNYQTITLRIEQEMQKQLQEFRATLLVNFQKEIDIYKQQKIKDADKTVDIIIQKVSQKVLNKAISLEDHQNLIIESLEKSLKEGVFD